MEPVAVDCQFRKDGTIRVRRIKDGDLWRPVTQGRQWLDDRGRHVLIMIGDTNVRTLTLGAQSLIWQIAPDHSSRTTAV